MNSANQDSLFSINQVKDSQDCSDKNIAQVDLPPLEPPLKSFGKKKSPEIDKWKHLMVSLKVVFGTKILSLEEISQIKEGDVLSLNEMKNQPLEIYLNETKVGYGEIVAIDEHFGIQFTHLIKD